MRKPLISNQWPVISSRIWGEGHRLRPAVQAFRQSKIKNQKSDIGFTIIEIAISLAVIGFALVAIIGVLPSAMQVQKENRQETIIDADASVLLNSIREGAGRNMGIQGLDDLTNQIVAIVNYRTVFDQNGKPLPSLSSSILYTATNTVPPAGFVAPTPIFLLTNGYRIVGLLSTPKYTPGPAGTPGSYYSNYVVAAFRAMSGDATDGFPQKNVAMLEDAFQYRTFLDVSPFAHYDSAWTNVNPLVTDTNLIAAHSNYWMVVKNLQTNLHEVRLTFRWPILPTGNLGNGRQIFRTLTSGQIVARNDPTTSPAPPQDNPPDSTKLYFFEPRTFVKAP